MFALTALNALREDCRMSDVPRKNFTVFDDECYSSIVDSAKLVWISLEVDDGSDNPPDYFMEISSEESIGDIANSNTHSVISGNYSFVGLYDAETLDDVVFCKNTSANSRRIISSPANRRRLSDKNNLNVKPHVRYVTSPTITADMWNEIPQDWDWRDHMPSEKLYNSKAAASVPLSQGACGSCYVFGGVTGMAYRFNIASNGSVNTVPSPEVVMSCANGCEGGSFDMVYSAMKTNYIPSHSAEPYTEQKLLQCNWTYSTSLQLKARDFSTSDDPAMPTDDSQPFIKGVKGERAMMYEVYKNGPGGVYVKVEDQFQGYSGDSVLEDKTCTKGADGVICVYTSADTNHACTLVGWGVDNGKRYWLVGLV